jgi:hypothetical protein
MTDCTQPRGAPRERINLPPERWPQLAGPSRLRERAWRVAWLLIVPPALFFMCWYGPMGGIAR